MFLIREVPMALPGHFTPHHPRPVTKVAQLMLRAHQQAVQADRLHLRAR